MKQPERKEDMYESCGTPKPKKGVFSRESDGLCPVLPKGMISAAKVLGRQVAGEWKTAGM